MIDGQVKSELHNRFRQGNITLFLGAGTSMANGLPDWKKLVTSIYFGYMRREEWERMKPFPNYLYALSKWYIEKTGDSLDIIVRKIKSGCEPELYKRLLWESLYTTYIDAHFISGGENQRSELLDSIASIIAAGRKIQSVITYNFDDLLENTLKKSGYEDFEPVYSAGNRNASKIPLFHVHGYIPFNDNQQKQVFGDIILSEEDYNGIANTPNHWANMRQLASLMMTTNIMIGLSLTDRNLRRILDITRNVSDASRNFVFLKRSTQPALGPEDFKLIDMEARKLKELWQKNPYIKSIDQLQQVLPDILNNMHYYHSDTEARVFEDLRITPVWYDDHNEIPQLLNDLAVS